MAEEPCFAQMCDLQTHFKICLHLKYDFWQRGLDVNPIDTFEANLAQKK